jgi:CheY-like chemotaxis protein
MVLSRLPSVARPTSPPAAPEAWTLNKRRQLTDLFPGDHKRRPLRREAPDLHKSDKAAVTILVVDDEEVVTNILGYILTCHGYEVYLARDGRQGVNMARQIRPDLILMDIAMPRLDGYAATEEIKQDSELTDTPVIYITGRPEDEDDGRPLTTGGAAFVRKPFTQEQMLSIIEQVLGQKGRSRISGRKECQ